MFNTRGSRNIVLTFQSAPPFLIENFVAIALAILMAVPLVLRIHRFLGNRNNHQALSPIRKFHHKFQHRDQCRLVRTIRSTPNFNRGGFWSTQSKNELPPINDHDDSDSHQSLDEFDIYNYDYYRYKLIAEKLAKQYGLHQAPGDLIFNSLHLNAIDSNTEIRSTKRYEPNFFNCMESYVGKQDKNITRVPLIHLRDYFLTKTITKKPDTLDKAIDTTVSIIEIDQLPEMISPKERSKPFPEVSRRQKELKAKPDDKFNKFSNENEMLKKTIDFGSNSRPSSPSKGAKTIPDESTASERISILKEPLKKDHSIPSTPKSTKKVSHLRKPRELAIIQDKIDYKSIRNKSDKEKNNSIPNRSTNKSKELKINDIKAQLMEPKQFQDNEGSIQNINKISTISILPEEEKFLSSVTSDVFNSSNSYLSRPQSRRSRPNSSGTSSRAFKHFMPKVNSRPRSSGGSFAWEVPEDSGTIWSVENSNESKPTSTVRPKSANPAISRKKSVAAMSVLESIIDLTYNVTIDTQDSFTTMRVDEIKRRLENSASPLELKHSINCSRDEKISKSSSKAKISGQRPISKGSNLVTNQSFVTGQKRTFLQARSGKH